MGERPVSETVDALGELADLVARETAAVADDAREQTSHVAGVLRATSGHTQVTSVADEIDALSTQMQSILSTLPGELSRVIQDEITGLQHLLAPDATAAVAQPGLDALPAFERTDTTGHNPPVDETHRSQPDESPRLVRFSSEAEFNAAAESPRPDTTYEYLGVQWRTDHLARTVSVTGTPRLEPATRRPRRQAEIGHQGQPTDVGFHLLGHAFGGPTNPLNVVPANGYRLEDGLANLNQGAYQKFENEIRNHLKAGHDVRVEIHAIYNPGKTTRRPDKLVANVSVDGAQQAEYKFKNK